MTPTPSIFLITSSEAFAAGAQRAAAEAGGLSVAGRASLSGGSATQAAIEASRAGAVLLIDMDGDQGTGLRALVEVKRRLPAAAVLVAIGKADADSILHFMRSGAADVLRSPLEGKALADALGRMSIRSREVQEGRPDRGRVMAFVGAKGGCGATTAAVNVAAALCGMPKGGAGRSVILLDLDAPGGDAAAMLRLEPSYSLADLAANIHRLDLSLLTSMTMRHASGLHILAAANEGARPGPVGEEQLAAIVAFLRDHFDDVVLAGGALDRSHVAAVSQAHLVHLVTTLDFLSLRRAKTIMARLRDLCVSGETVRVVVNRLDRTPDLKLGDVRQALGEPVAWTIPLDAATVEHAVNEGVPFATSGRGRIQAAYAKYVEGLGNGPQGPRGPHRSDGPHGEEEPRLRMGLLRRLIPGRAGAAS